MSVTINNNNQKKCGNMSTNNSSWDVCLSKASIQVPEIFFVTNLCKVTKLQSQNWMLQCPLSVSEMSHDQNYWLGKKLGKLGEWGLAEQQRTEHISFFLILIFSFFSSSPSSSFSVVLFTLFSGQANTHPPERVQRACVLDSRLLFLNHIGHLPIRAQSESL